MSPVQELHSTPKAQPPSARSGSGPVENPRVARALEEYLAALERGPAPDRQAFLARHADIAAPLGKCLDGLEFIQAAVPGPAEADVATGAATDYPVAPLGDFRILREVGRGGMGVVYEAVQLSLGRRVALKVLPFAATLDALQLQRFKNEAQITAHLQHQNIVPVYAVGCERGVHFYAMQFIDGRTLAAVIAELRQQGRREPTPPTPDADRPDAAPGTSADTHPHAGLSTAPSLRSAAYVRGVAHLGVQAAEALEHAHQLGVVHRDIKPANLLVDGRGNVWITDFGLAQCQGQAGLTLTGDRVGTARYMSPEQASGRHGPLDHRTDIYSLGVTLYELLTLEPACPGADWAEVQAQILLKEPRRPRRLNPAIPPDLETILLKATAKEPDTRYPTAQALAADLRRFLEDRPIQARRPTLWQRTRKWGRRHPSVVGALIFSLAVAVVALAGSTLMIQRQKERAEETLRVANDALDQVCMQVLEKRLPMDPLLVGEERELVQKTLGFYEELIRKNSDNPALRPEIGRAYRRAGNLYKMLEQPEQAKAAYQQAIIVLEQLVAHHPAVPAYRHELARTYNSLGGLYWTKRQLPEGEQALQRALDIQRTLVADFPTEPRHQADLANYYNSIGLLYRAAGRFPEARTAFQQAVDLNEGPAKDCPSEVDYRVKLIASLLNLGGLLSLDRGRLAEAEAVMRRAHDLGEQLMKDFPDRPDHWNLLASNLTNLADLYQQTHRPAEAQQAFRRSVDLSKRIVAERPAVPRYQMELAGRHGNLGLALQKAGRLAESETEYRQGIDRAKRLVERWPSVPAYRECLAGCYAGLGFVQRAARRHPEAEESYRLALDLMKGLVDEFPAVPAYRQNLASEYHDLGLVMYETKRIPEAEHAYRQALDLRKRLLNDFPSWPHDRYQHGSTLAALSAMLALRGDYVEAAEVAAELSALGAGEWNTYYLAAEALIDCVQHAASDGRRPQPGRQQLVDRYVAQARHFLQEAVSRSPPDPEVQITLARCLVTCPVTALRDAHRAVDLARRAVGRSPTNGRYQAMLGMALYRDGEWTAAVAALMRAQDLLEDNDNPTWFFLAMAHWQLGDKTAALKWYHEGVQWMANHEPDAEVIRPWRAEAAALLNVPDPEMPGPR